MGVKMGQTELGISKCHLLSVLGPALNDSWTIQYFEHSDVIQIRNRTTFTFYPGLQCKLYSKR